MVDNIAIVPLRKRGKKSVGASIVTGKAKEGSPMHPLVKSSGSQESQSVSKQPPSIKPIIRSLSISILIVVRGPVTDKQ